MAKKGGKKGDQKNAVRRRGNAKPVSRRAEKKGNSGAGSFRQNILPLLLNIFLLFCLGVVFILGYRAIAASDFFEVTRVDIYGSKRSSRDNIERIVRLQTEQTGAWNAELGVLKAKIEKLTFVRSAAVSRVLPNGIRVSVFEHEPKAIIKIASGRMLVNEEGRILAPAKEKEENIPFELKGWDESSSEKADRENSERLKLYMKMLAEWRENGVESRVIEVDLADLRSPRAIVEDSGKTVFIAVGRENFGENLVRGIRAITGKGEVFSGVDLVGSSLRLNPRRPDNRPQAKSDVNLERLP